MIPRGRVPIVSKRYHLIKTPVSGRRGVNTMQDSWDPTVQTGITSGFVFSYSTRNQLVNHVSRNAIHLSPPRCRSLYIVWIPCAYHGGLSTPNEVRSAVAIVLSILQGNRLDEHDRLLGDFEILLTETFFWCPEENGTQNRGRLLG